VHATSSGLAALVAADRDDAVHALADLLDHLPDNHLTGPPRRAVDDDPDRPCHRAAAAVPDDPSQAYDVRDVIADVVDRDSLLEVHEHHATNLVTAYARLDGRAVAVVANQPAVRAGTLDIAASVKGARHVQLADAFGLPVVTFVDTPGYQPGRTMERDGMIRHGAKLAHAYAAATVPRLCVILRKAYGGAFIVMDSASMGSDLVLAWPRAEIAVMGAAGATEVLHRGELDPAVRAEREAQYRATHCTPRIAADRGFVDDVIDPADTRRVLTSAVRRLRSKQPVLPNRKHANPPL
jgi:acetyl-CoA carboxylase carboxyltransferase component